MHSTDEKKEKEEDLKRKMDNRIKKIISIIIEPKSSYMRSIVSLTETVKELQELEKKIQSSLEKCTTLVLLPGYCKQIKDLLDDAMYRKNNA